MGAVPGEASCLFAGNIGHSNSLCAERARSAAARGANCTRFVNTRKYDERCHGEASGQGVRLFDLLVTGAGGSGTNLAASALEQLGMTLGHEHIEGGGSSSWIHAVNDAVVGAKYPFPRRGPHKSTGILPESSPRFRTVVHQVIRRN